MYKVLLTCFGYVVYEGPDYQAAREKAVAVGFECTIYLNNTVISTYSPIGGWRTFNYESKENC